MDNKNFQPKPDPPLVDSDKLGPRDRALFDDGPGSFSFLGFGHTPTLGPRPKRNVGLAERVYGCPTVNGSFTMGNQRGNGGLAEGYGGQGIESPTIDLTVGHMGPYAKTTDGNGRQLLYNPNKEIDAASFYISSLDTPDEVLNLPDGSIGNKKGLSSIAGIAEAIRFRAKGEGGMKFVCLPSNRSSRGQKNLENAVIEFIGDTEASTQPLVLGDNLIALLKEMSEDIDNVRETMSGFIKDQGELNDKVMNHNHNSPFYALTTAPAFNLLFEGIKSAFKRVAVTEVNAINTIVNKESSQSNYFTPMQEKYILSSLVRTT